MADLNPNSGNAPGLSALTRRSLLAFAPLALVPTPTLALATSDAATPIMRLYAQWDAWIDASDGFDWTDEEWEARTPERYRLEDAIKAEPPTDLRDLAVKVLVLSGEGCWALPDEMTLECAGIVGRSFAKLPRCLFQKEAA